MNRLFFVWAICAFLMTIPATQMSAASTAEPQTKEQKAKEAEKAKKAKEAEKARKAKEAEREKKMQQAEKERQAKAAQTAKAQAEREKAAAQKAKEMEKAQAEREKVAQQKAKEAAQAQAQRDKVAAQKAQEAAQAQAERDKVAEQKAKEAAQAQAQREKVAEQKAKEAAQAQAQREKAAEQKAKEAAQAQAQREKAAEQKAKEAAQAQAQREKAAEQKAKEAAKLQAEREKEAQKRPSQEEVYQTKLQEVQKYNQRVARYMARDIAHRLGFWGQVGYSSLFNSGLGGGAYTPKSAGWVGGGIGLGYQLRYKKFLLTTGVEFESYNTQVGIFSPQGKQPLAHEFAMQPYQTMRYTYTFNQMNDLWQTGYVQIPLLFGMEFLNGQYYFLAGPKVGLNIMGTSAVSGNYTTTIQDLEFNDPLVSMPNHALVNEMEYGKVKSKIDALGINVALSAEIGMSLDQWLQPKPERGKKLTPAQKLLQRMHTKVALFAEYGVLNVFQPSLPNDLDPIMFATPADYTKVLAGEDPIKDLAFRSALNTVSAKNAKLNPFLVGVKFSMMWDLPRKDMKPKALPKEPSPRMMTRVIDQETGKYLAGAAVSITSERNGRVTNKTSNSRGYASARLLKGNYQVAANKVGYYPSDTLFYALEKDLKDTLIISLQPEPKPIVYTYAGRVYAQDTKEPLEAQVLVRAANDTTLLYNGVAADDGLFVTNLTAGDYITTFRMPGFVETIDTVHFVQDTLQTFMPRVKLGVTIRIENLFFATARTIILPESKQSMDDLAQFMLDNPTVEIRIIGHTDSVGNSRSNKALSEGRANAVRRELIKRDIAADRIEAEGHGEDEPIAPNATEEGRALNRRVEFMIISTGGEDIKQIFDDQEMDDEQIQRLVEQDRNRNKQVQ